MEIKLITADKLRITLDKCDMERLSISYEQIDHNSDGTRKALLSLLERAKMEAGFNPLGAKLFIEVYPNDSDGCVIYVTAMRTEAARRMEQRKPGSPPVVFEFGDAEPLIRCSVQAQALYGRRIYQSALYRLGSRYRLIVYPLDYNDRLSVYFLSEYGRAVGEGEILAAFTKEHGEEILPEDALEILSDYFEEEL